MPVAQVAGEGRLALAKDVFVNDYLLVMENDFDAWNDLQETARRSESISELADTLREEWDNYVDQVSALAEKEWGSDAPATLLIRQIMGGWGDSEWFAIAKSVKGE